MGEARESGAVSSSVVVVVQRFRRGVGHPYAIELMFDTTRDQESISDYWPLNGRQINAPTLVKQQPRRQNNPENRPHVAARR